MATVDIFVFDGDAFRSVGNKSRCGFPQSTRLQFPSPKPHICCMVTNCSQTYFYGYVSRGGHCVPMLQHATDVQRKRYCSMERPKKSLADSCKARNFSLNFIDQLLCFNDLVTLSYSSALKVLSWLLTPLHAASTWCHSRTERFSAWNILTNNDRASSMPR